MTPAIVRTLGLAAVLVLAACSEPLPTGQILAIVDGDDVTQRDLAAEGPFEQGKSAGVLRDLVDRRLLADAARVHGIEQTPEFLAALRRAREQLLVQGLGRQLSTRIPDPRPAEIAAYIASHPLAFAGRSAVTLERTDGTGALTLDSARLAPDVAGQLLAKRVGETVVYGGATWRKRSSLPAPLTGQDARQFALQSFRGEKLSAELEHIIASRRATTSILYNDALGLRAK